MSRNDIERARHALEKGRLLKTLAQEYGRAPVTVASLYRLMDRLASPMSADGLQFALGYLSDQGYVAATRRRDLPGFRTDRPEGNPDDVVTVKLTPKGLQLADGEIAADPLVAFE